ncbi:MAG: 2-oxoacid:ferredoxin oxidoreductase subunit beta [Proteobacteria bacterium]|nr:2-oxoacid:ferredoxin oxidoreductase subunit beta [Pseudomonadota bacterium]MBU1641275.1 2-oxoacid:ferredoxin oxidoreductase subunit beta [Pseudomonadota bacterium]
MLTFDDYKGQQPSWCPGCGNFAILNTLKKVFVDLAMQPHQFTIVSGIGQGAKLPHYTKCNTFNGLHGRTLPVATGIRLANNHMTVLALAGDGDCYGEGGNHLIHAIRRNINVTLLVHNNQVYGLTKGQASPTTPQGRVTKIQPSGSLSEPLNPLAMAISLNCSFVARGFAGASGLPFLQEIIKEAIRHEGFAMVDILQNCVTFNKVNTFHWYKERAYELEAGYDPTDRVEAFRRSLEWGERIPTGIFYRNDRPSYEQGLTVLKEDPLVKQALFRKDMSAELAQLH